MYTSSSSVCCLLRWIIHSGKLSSNDQTDCDGCWRGVWSRPKSRPVTWGRSPQKLRFCSHFSDVCSRGPSQNYHWICESDVNSSPGLGVTKVALTFWNDLGRSGKFYSLQFCRKAERMKLVFLELGDTIGQDYIKLELGVLFPNSRFFWFFVWFVIIVLVVVVNVFIALTQAY